MVAAIHDRIRIEDDCAFVVLTKGYESMIDLADVDLISRWRWSAVEMRAGAYARRNRLGKSVPLHRFLMGEPDGLCIDHINGNTLDNRRSNLRVATVAQNGWNARKRTDNSTGARGVSHHPRDRRFHANIRSNGRKVFLGSFASLEEASVAYEHAARQLRGEFVRPLVGEGVQ